MKPDDLEHRIAATPLRQPPASWRDAILHDARVAAATSTVRSRSPARNPRPWESLLQRLVSPWSGIATAIACGLLFTAIAQRITPNLGSPAPSFSRNQGQTLTETLRFQRAELLSLADHDDAELPETRHPSPYPTTPASQKPRSDISPNRLPVPAPPTPRPA